MTESSVNTEHDLYFLRTERLGFRTWRPEDIDLADALWGDADVTKWIGGPFSEEQVEARLTYEMLDMQMNGVQYWPIFLLDGGFHVGCCGLRPYDLDGQIYEIGFHIRWNHWGQGYAFEAASAVIDYAFCELRCPAIFAGHHPENLASARILSKLGFKFTRDELYKPTGVMHPSYLLKMEDYDRLELEQ